MDIDAKWDDIQRLFDLDMSENPEASGTAFLKVNGDPPKLDVAQKAVVDGFRTAVGCGKPPKGSLEAKVFYVSKVQNAIQFAAFLTGNEEHHVACCIDVDTVKKFDITRSCTLPPFRMEGNNLPTLFLDYCKQCYNAYIDEEERLHLHATQGSSAPIQRASFDQISPLLSVGIRITCQYWCMNPALPRQQCYIECWNAMKLECSEESKPKIRPVNVIKRLQSDFVFDALLKELNGLPTETVDGQEAFTMDADEDSRAILGQFLLYGLRKPVKYNGKAYPLHQLLHFQAEIRKLDDGDPRKTALAKYVAFPLRKTESTIAIQAGLDAAKEREQKKKANKEQREIKKKEKVKKNLENRLQLQNQALSAPTPAPAPAPAPAPVLGKGSKRKQVAPVKPVSKKEQKKAAEFKAIKSYATETLPFLPYCSTTLGDATPKSTSSKPIKTYTNIADEGATVVYTKPGRAFISAMKSSINNVCFILDKMDEKHPAAMSRLFAFAAGEVEKAKNRRLSPLWTSDGGMVVACVLMADADKELTFSKDADGEDDMEMLYVDAIVQGMENFAVDVRTILPFFVGAGRLPVLPQYLAAFFVIATMEHGWGDVSYEELFATMKAMATKHLPADEATTITQLVLATKLIGSDNKTERRYDPFEIKVECELPTERSSVGVQTRQKEQRQKKKMVQLLGYDPSTQDAQSRSMLQLLEDARNMQEKEEKAERLAKRKEAAEAKAKADAAAAAKKAAEAKAKADADAAAKQAAKAKADADAAAAPAPAT